MLPEQEQILINKLNAGDRKALETIFRLFYPRLTRYAQHYLADPDTAAQHGAQQPTRSATRGLSIRAPQRLHLAISRRRDEHQHIGRGQTGKQSQRKGESLHTEALPHRFLATHQHTTTALQAQLFKPYQHLFILKNIKTMVL